MAADATMASFSCFTNDFNDGGTYKHKVYVDGVDDHNSTGTTSTSVSASADILIGSNSRRHSDNTDSGFRFNGKIRDVQVL